MMMTSGEHIQKVRGLIPSKMALTFQYLQLNINLTEAYTPRKRHLAKRIEAQTPKAFSPVVMTMVKIIISLVTIY